MKSEESLHDLMRFDQKNKYQNNQDSRRGKNREGGRKFKEIMPENFPNLGKKLGIQVHKDSISIIQCKMKNSKTLYNETGQNQREF